MEILIIGLLTLLNGFFSLSEIALVSVKDSRMQALAEGGSFAARTVLRLRKDPENFLSSVQVGITLIGIIAGAYGGAALTDDMQGFLSRWPAIQPYAHETALALVIGSITYFTIVVGELVPKSIALNDPERIALAVAPVIHVFTMATFPLVKALSFSTSVLVKLLRIKETDQDRLSEEELRAIIRTANAQGVLDKQESEAHENLFRFSDHVARTLMTRRGELEWLDSTRPLEELLDQVRGSLRSKFPVCKGDLDEIQGILTARDLFEAADAPAFKLEDVVVPPIIVPENAPAFTILKLFRKRKQYAAVVVDEHGQLEGLITLHDLTEAIVGDLPDEDDPHEHRIVKRADGSLLVDGQVLISDLNQYAGITLIHELDSGYATVAGHFLQRLERVPIPGDTIRDERFSGEVMDMDGNRIDKVLIRIHPV